MHESGADSREVGHYQRFGHELMVAESRKINEPTDKRQVLFSAQAISYGPLISDANF